MKTPDDENGERIAHRCEHHGWTVWIDAHWQKAIICIPANIAEECLFASIGSESIVVFPTGAADEAAGSECVDPIRILPLPFKVEPENCSAQMEGGNLVICLSRAAGEIREPASMPFAKLRQRDLTALTARWQARTRRGIS